jgi:ankyrin repeat protein
MSADSPEKPHSLPRRPNLRQLKDQAKDLLKSGQAASLGDAQFQIARLYGFPSWPKLRARVEWLADLWVAFDTRDVERLKTLLGDQVKALIKSRAAASQEAARDQVARLLGLTEWEEIETRLISLQGGGRDMGQLERAIASNDLDRVQKLMTNAPALHKAPIGYGKSGPLTCVAECGVPPSATRLAMARWMIEDGSDVHQGGDGPLMRAALVGGRIPMMELLVSHGADVNALWDSTYPIIFAACESVDPVSLKWLLEHGANPNCRGKSPFSGTALDYVIGSYVRSPDLSACIDILLKAGGTTKYKIPAVMELLAGRLDGLAALLNADRTLVNARFPKLDFGMTGGRLLTLKGATLLHVAAEYCSLDAVRLLLSRGADVNALASIDGAGVGGQTPIFHAVTQLSDGGVAVTELLIASGADLSIRARVPGHYERPLEIVECTPLGYAVRFQDVPNRADKMRTVALLRAKGAAK